MTAEANRKLVEEYLNAWAKNDTTTLNRIVDAKYRFNNPPPGISPDKKGLIEQVEMFHAAFPDMRVTPERWVIQGNDVVCRFRTEGTHKGEFLGIQPTNKRVTTEILMLVTVRDGKIVEDISEWDSFGLFAQLGEMPELESPLQ